MIAAALYLTRRSLVNATRRRVARLRQPKYLIGFLVGGLYLYWLLFRPRPGTGVAALGSAGADVLAVGLVGTLVGLNWLFGSAETPFSFTLAETQYLFTAPLTRRQVINFKLLRSQLSLLISAAVTALVLSSGHLGGLRLVRVIGLWLLYGTLQLHYAAMSLVRASLAQHGVTGLRRRFGTLLVLGGVAGLAWWGLREQLPVVVSAFEQDPGRGVAALAGAIHTGVLGVLLWPLEAVVAPLRAAGLAEFARHVPAALLVLAAHYVWVVRSTIAFEEAAVEHAGKQARRLDAMRQGRSLYRTTRPPKAAGRLRLRLAPTGASTRAILWKNAVGATRESSPRTLVLSLALAVTASLSLAHGAVGGRDLVAVLLLVFAGVALLFGPFALRFDLRRDLEMLDVLKAYPVRGRQVVSGEVAAPVTLIGAVVWTCLLGAFVASVDRAGSGLPALADRLALLLALLPATAAVLLVLVLVQNAAALLFPAWVSIGRDRAVGLEATGQRILTMGGSMVALVAAILPAAIVGAIAAAAARAVGLSGVWDLTVGSVAGSAVVAGEGVLTVRLLGRVFDRMEPLGAGTG